MIRFFVLALLVLAGSLAHGHPPDDARGERSNDGDRREYRPFRGRHHVLADIPVPDGVSVPTWDELSTERQASLARMKEDWDTMPASRRVMALERLERRARWDALPEEERDRLREGARNFHDLTPELKDRMRASMQAMHDLPEPERRKLFERWRGLSPEQRRTWLESGGPGISPAPPGD